MLFWMSSCNIKERKNTVNTPECLTTLSHALIISRDEILSQDLEKKLTDIKAFESIHVVNDCLDGIDYVQKNHPDLIIFDTEVSVLEVLNALRAVKSLSDGIHCVVIADHIGYHALLSMVGADKILYKGFSKTELACCLN
jgi:two-component SAPR family response regulator